jgi:hypothetical protein
MFPTAVLMTEVKTWRLATRQHDISDAVMMTILLVPCTAIPCDWFNVPRLRWHCPLSDGYFMTWRFESWLSSCFQVGQAYIHATQPIILEFAFY